MSLFGSWTLSCLVRMMLRLEIKMRSASFFLGDVITRMNFSEGIFFSLGGFKILPYIANRVEA